jgi:putative SOS response-associated peptidase YedK
MCAHYESVYNKALLKAHFGVTHPSEAVRHDVWPGYFSVLIRRHENAEVGDEAVPLREALPGRFGLIPHWAKDPKIARQTYNARTETVAEKPSFRDAWKRAQHCLIPVQSFFEPDWRSGKAVPTRVTLANDEPMGLAGLWAQWRSPQGETVHSFTLLTINADAHPLMRHFHRPHDEKRMIVVVPPERYDDWLQAQAPDRADFLQAWPAEGFKITTPTNPLPQTASLFKD